MDPKENSFQKRWGIASSSGLHLSFVDGMRGIAIIMVVAAHAFYYNPEGSWLFVAAGKFLGAGVMGVPIFFVLSGFLVSYPFFKERGKNLDFSCPPGYAIRRGLKVFPPFLLVVVLLCAYYLWKTGDARYLWLGFAWFVGLGNFLNLEPYFNTSFWSLWVEVHFYILLPLMFFLLRRRRQPGVGWIMFFLLLVPALAARAWFWREGLGHNESHFLMRRFPAALDGFAWGVLFAGYYCSPEKAHGSRARLAWLGYVGLVVILLSMIAFGVIDYRTEIDAHPTRWWFEFTRIVPAIGTFLVLFFAFDPTRAGARILTATPLAFIGVISYEWFLIHQPVFFEIRAAIGGAQGSLWRYAAIVILPVVLTLMAAAGIYRWFSLPLMRWGRNRLLPKSANRPSAS